VTCYLQYPENVCQRSVNSFMSFIFRKQGIARNFAHISWLFTALQGKNNIYARWSTDTKLIDIANCTTSKRAWLVAENATLIRYYYHTANTWALYESIDGPAGQPADNPPISDRLRVYHRTIPECTVCIYWSPGPSLWQSFALYPDPDLKSQSGPVANTTHVCCDSKR